MIDFLYFITTDPEKGKRLKQNRGRDFQEVQEIFYSWHYEDQRFDHPEQSRAIGWSKAQLYTVIYEERKMSKDRITIE